MENDVYFDIGWFVRRESQPGLAEKLAWLVLAWPWPSEIQARFQLWVIAAPGYSKVSTTRNTQLSHTTDYGTSMVNIHLNMKLQ